MSDTATLKSSYEVDVIDRGEPWTYATEASSPAEAKAQARSFFGYGVKIVLVRLVRA